MEITIKIGEYTITSTSSLKSCIEKLEEKLAYKNFRILKLLNRYHPTIHPTIQVTKREWS